MSAYSHLTDVELDTAYDAYRKAGISGMSGAQIMAEEIVSRLASVSGFVGGMFGASRFPKYESWMGGMYSQAGAAQSSAADHAASVASSITTGIGTGLFNMLGPTLPVLLVAAFIVYQVKQK